MPGHSLQVKDNFCTSHLLPQGKKHNAGGPPLGFEGNIFHTWENYFNPFIRLVEGRQCWVRLQCKQLCWAAIWSGRPHGTGSICGRKGCCWCRGQTPIGGSLSIELEGSGAWSYHWPFKNHLRKKTKELLACYWAMIETEALSMGHQVTTYPELSS